MNKDSKIYIAGHRGLVGSAIHRKLVAEGYTNLVVRTHRELDLENPSEVNDFFVKETPDYIFLAAAKVGGVIDNSEHPAQFLYKNLCIQNNVIHAAHLFSVKKLLFLGSNCLYPRFAAEPLKEEYLMAGKLEATTEAYAIAKLAGIKMCEYYRKQYGCNFITALPVNVYGENDTYDANRSHVMPALLRKFKESEGEVEVWGTGNARREFIHSDDLSEACLFLMMNYNESEPINVGTDQEVSIKELAHLIGEIIDFKGWFTFDTSKPDGIMGKLLDSSKINALGWKPKIELREGIKRVYDSL